MFFSNSKFFSSEAGFSLLETMVASAILSSAILGFMKLTELSQKTINTINETYKIAEIKNKIQNRLSTRQECFDTFDSFINWTSLNSTGLSLEQGDSSHEIALNGIYNGKRHLIQKLEILPLTISPDPLVPLPAGGFYKATAEIKITLKNKRTARARLRSNTMSLSQDSLPFIFHINKDGTLKDCYSRNSKTVATQLNLCNNLGGVLTGDKCLFPEFLGNVDEITEDPTNPLSQRKLSDVLCQLERKTVLIKAEGIADVMDPDDPIVVLIPGVVKGLAVTKYCKIPQGKDPDSALEYLP